MSEIWKAVSGYDDEYQVSSLGRVKSFDRTCYHKDGKVTQRKGRILKQCLRAGYPFVHLRGRSGHLQVSTHRLVAQEFCVKPDGCDVVNHIDGDKTNNKVENLEWTTYSGNFQHAAISGLWKAPQGEAIGSSKLKESDIDEVRKMIIAGRPYSEIAALFNVKIMCISDIKTGKTWGHVGEPSLKKACNEAESYLSKGNNHSRSKLTESDVVEIIKLLRSGLPQKEIARNYDCIPETVSRINLGKVWRHIVVDECGKPPYYLVKPRKAHIDAGYVHPS